MVPVEYVLEVASRGYPVFPCVPYKKRPMTTNGLLDATTDEETIRAWWEEEPSANIGLRTDELLVVDVDTASWPAEESHREDLARAPAQRTPRGGSHFIFRQPPGAGWRSSASRIAKGVDIRADGGYVLLAPSYVIDPEKGIDGPYEWLSELPPRKKLPLPPGWLEALLDKKHGETRGYQPHGIVPAGSRHAHLLSLAGALAHQGVSDATGRERLEREVRERCASGDHPISEKEIDDLVRYLRIWRESEHSLPADPVRLREQLIAQALRHWEGGDRQPMVALLDYYEGIRKEEEHLLLGALAKATARYPEGDIAALAAYVEDTSGPVEAAVIRVLMEEGGPSDRDTFERRFSLLADAALRARLKQITETENGRTDIQTSRALERRAELVALLRRDSDVNKDVFIWNDSSQEPDEPLPDPLIVDLLYPGLTFVSGIWKQCMKTTIVTAILQHISAGAPFLGRPVRQRRCGFVQLDTPIPRFLATARDLRVGMNLQEHGIYGLRGKLDLRQTESKERLVRFCKDAGIELLGIDALASVYLGNENHAEEVKPVLRGFLLEVLRDKMNIDIVILSHPNRVGTSTIRGSGEWEAAADSNWKLTAKVNDDVTESVTISVSGRHAPHRITLAFDYPEPGINGRPGHAGVTIREVAAPTKPGPQRKSPIRQVLQEATTWLSTNNACALAKCSKKTGAAELARMLMAGEVDRRDREGRGGGDEWRLRDAIWDPGTIP